MGRKPKTLFLLTRARVILEDERGELERLQSELGVRKRLGRKTRVKMIYLIFIKRDLAPRRISVALMSYSRENDRGKSVRRQNVEKTRYPGVALVK